MTAHASSGSTRANFDPLMIWRLSIFLIALFAAAARLNASDGKLTNVDYFLRLPPDTLEASPAAWLNHCDVIDKQTGLMNGAADGGQPNFQVALFRDHDGKPLLALCQGQLEGED